MHSPQTRDCQRKTEGFIMKAEKVNLRRKGFTLIELLVVIAIIALLLSILMPSLQMVKKQARKTVCKAHLHSWGLIFSLYGNDYESKFPNWSNRYASEGNMWMDVLIPYYENIDEMRFCGEAIKGKERHPTGSVEGAYGSPTRSWLHPTPNGNLTYDGQNWANGSYGINHYAYGYDETNIPWSLYYTAEMPWGRIGGMREASNVPLLFDCTWAGTFPSGSDQVPPDGSGILGIGINNEMARVCLDRHGKENNILFMDTAVRGVQLPDLWKLKWHRIWIDVEYTRNDFVDESGGIWLP